MSGWRMLEARGREIADRAVARRVADVVRAVETDAPGVTARVEGADVVLQARGLLTRWMSDARLREAGRGGQ
jgi:hypothetical protein